MIRILLILAVLSFVPSVHSITVARPKDCCPTKEKSCDVVRIVQSSAHRLSNLTI